MKATVECVLLLSPFLWFGAIFAIDLLFFNDWLSSLWKPPTTPRAAYFAGYCRFFMGIVAATTAYAMLTRPWTLNRLEWWGILFFVLYYVIQVARDLPDNYSGTAFIVDLAGIGIYYLVAKTLGLLTSDSALPVKPAVVFLGILTIPLFAVASRLLVGQVPRCRLSVFGAATAAFGFCVSCSPEFGMLRAAAMALLYCGLFVYVAEDWRDFGGRSSARAIGAA